MLSEPLASGPVRRLVKDRSCSRGRPMHTTSALVPRCGCSGGPGWTPTWTSAPHLGKIGSVSPEMETAAEVCGCSRLLPVDHLVPGWVAV